MSRPLIDQIINHPNSTFTSDSILELECLSEPVLAQLLLGLTSAPDKDVQTLNSSVPNATEIQTLLEDLSACQEDLQNVAKEENRILSALNKYGVKRPSVLTYNTNNAAAVNDVMIQNYVQTGRTPLAVMLNEGMMARKELRSKAINEILSNTSGVYTPNDLDRMSSADLSKLSNALQVKTRPIPQSDYSAVGLADNFQQVTAAFPANNFGDGVISNDPIDPPKLW